MGTKALTQTIVTGTDPRGLAEFSAIREEINKASHPSQPELNWKLVESLALTIFEKNGVDLHTATYYTLARTRHSGLAGFCEGIELLAVLIDRQWDKFWPMNPQARAEMLDWLNSRTGNILRHQLSFSAADLPLLYRAERALQIICNKLQQQTELKRPPRVENLLWFIHNSRTQQEAQPPGNAANAVSQATVKTLIYTPDSAQTLTSDGVTRSSLPEPAEIRVAVHENFAVNAPPTKIFSPLLKGFVAGIVGMGLVAASLWWWQVRPLQQQMMQVRDTAQGAAIAWLASPQLSDYEQRIKPLPNVSPLHSLKIGMQMTQLADSRWPESLQQQQATTRWNNTLKARAMSSPQMQGWQQTRQHLRAFAELLLKREQNKEGFTLSHIKTVVYQAERMLEQDIPVEYLHTQYQEMLAQGHSASTLEKQINERLEGVLSRWLLLKEDDGSLTSNHN